MRMDIVHTQFLPYQARAVRDCTKNERIRDEGEDGHEGADDAHREALVAGLHTSQRDQCISRPGHGCDKIAHTDDDDVSQEVIATAVIRTVSLLNRPARQTTAIFERQLIVSKSTMVHLFRVHIEDTNLTRSAAHRLTTSITWRKESRLARMARWLIHSLRAAAIDITGRLQL